jgi:hypothetical protein
MPTGTPPPQLENSLRVAYEGTYGPCTWAVIHRFISNPSDVVTGAQLAAVLATLRDAFALRFITGPDTSNNLHLTRVAATRMNDSGTNVVRRVIVADSSGDGGTDDDPGQVAYLYNWSSGDPRQGGKARSYLPGVLDSDQSDEGRLLGSVVTGRTTQALAYLTAANAASSGDLDGLQMVEYSTVDGLAYRTTAAVYTIDDVALNLVLGTQRRRVGRLRG